MSKKFHLAEGLRLCNQVEALLEKVASYVKKEEAVYTSHTMDWARTDVAFRAREATLGRIEVQHILEEAVSKLPRTRNACTALLEDGNA